LERVDNEVKNASVDEDRKPQELSFFGNDKYLRPASLPSLDPPLTPSLSNQARQFPPHQNCSHPGTCVSSQGWKDTVPK
jgi:hypothetical protein